jgi:hypothetical protein
MKLFLVVVLLRRNINGEDGHHYTISNLKCTSLGCKCNFFIKYINPEVSGFRVSCFVNYYLLNEGIVIIIIMFE